MACMNCCVTLKLLCHVQRLDCGVGGFMCRIPTARCRSRVHEVELGLLMQGRVFDF